MVVGGSASARPVEIRVVSYGVITCRHSGQVASASFRRLLTQELQNLCSHLVSRRSFSGRETRHTGHSGSESAESFFSMSIAIGSRRSIDCKKRRGQNYHAHARCARRSFGRPGFAHEQNLLKQPGSFLSEFP